VKGTGYPLHSPVSPSLPLPCVTVCHHISTGLYSFTFLPLLNYGSITLKTDDNRICEFAEFCNGVRRTQNSCIGNKQ